MKKIKYRQCELTKKTAEGEARQVSYLPARYAVQGKVLKLLRNDVWDNGWVVQSAGDLIDEPLNWREAIKVHRDNTGDSEPKVVK